MLSLREKANKFKQAIASVLYSDEGYGLEICHDHADAVVDIVFIHGLTGHRKHTWTHAKCNVFWPSALLADDVPKSRITTFGYDANVVSLCRAKSTNRIQDHAMKLIDALTELRESTGTESRPILFVVHSLGGLVFKDAMTWSKQNGENPLGQIHTFTYGVCFLGTPHHGSHLATWGYAASKVINIVKSAEKSLLRNLRPGSEVLARINTPFDKMIENSSLKIVCFYEKRPMKWIREIVPQQSAVISGYPNYKINKNHIDMSKFSDKRDLGYRLILSQISGLVEEIRSNSQHSLSEFGQGASRQRIPARVEQQRLFIPASLKFSRRHTLPPGENRVIRRVTCSALRC